MTAEGVTFGLVQSEELREEARGDMRKLKTISRAVWSACLGCVLVAGIAGCGSADKAGSATSSYNAKFRKAHPVKAPVVFGQEDPAEMVAAFSTVKSGPVEVKFNLGSRPQVGQPTDVSVALIPAAGLESVSAVLQASDGLEIVDGGQIAKVIKPAAGAPLRQLVKVVPKRDGIFAVTAVVSVESGNQISSRSFSIPMIAGGGLGEEKSVASKGP
jgi:hypothetical protein